MKEIIIFIDDERSSRTIYKGTLQDIYGDEYFVVAIEPEITIHDMLKAIEKYENVVSIVIDEKLHVVVGTEYKGSQLVEAIRVSDGKLPLYILTSEMGLIEPPFGSVEYIIDKSKIEQDSYKNECAILMRRHINSFNDIKSERSERFDFLLRKSIDEDLTEAESKEYEELDFLRIKRVLSTESLVPSEELKKQEDLLEQIEDQLKKIDGE